MIERLNFESVLKSTLSGSEFHTLTLKKAALTRDTLRFLGRLPKVDLIILEGGKCPSVRPSVRPQTVSSI